jgi:hypothetical protein
MLPVGWWQWYISRTITVLDAIRRPASYLKTQRLGLRRQRLWVGSTESSLWNVVLLNIMSRIVIVIFMYHLRSFSVSVQTCCLPKELKCDVHCIYSACIEDCCYHGRHRNGSRSNSQSQAVICLWSSCSQLSFYVPRWPCPLRWFYCIKNCYVLFLGGFVAGGRGGKLYK